MNGEGLRAKLTAPRVTPFGAQARCSSRLPFPDSPALRRNDRAVTALHPEAGRPRGPLVCRMARLVARWREERDIDRQAALQTLGAAHAAIRPLFPQQKQVGSPADYPVA